MKSGPTEHRYAVVVAGGSGTRLWPLSREALPKQMQALMSDRSLIGETVDRLRGVVPIDHVYVSTTQNHAARMQELLPEIQPDNFIIEPESRGTPAAFALMAQRLHRVDRDAVVFTLASDHAIAELDKFQETMRTSYAFIEGHPTWLSTVGIAPTRPDTGLGYIRARESIQESPSVLRVEKYTEKPTHQVAQGYLDSGAYFWNAACYCFRADTLISAYRAADHRLVEATADYLNSGDPIAYRQAPVAVHEVDIIDNTQTPFALVPGDFVWSDIGNWAALQRSMSGLLADGVIARNAHRHTDIGSTNSLVLNTDDRIVVTAGLEKIAVIAMEDALLVVNLQRIEEVPDIMQDLISRLREDGREAYL